MGMQDEIGGVVRWDTPTVNAEESLREVIQKLIRSKASALVVKRNDVVVGIVSDIDLLNGLVDKKDMDETKVFQLMSACELITEKGSKSPCAQLDSSQSVESALGVISMAGTHNLLVSGLNEDEVGIVSIRDLLEVAIT